MNRYVSIRSRPAGSRLSIAATVLLAAAIGAAGPAVAGLVFEQSQTVAITGNPGKIKHCRSVGPVEITGSEQTADDRWLSFREQAVINGGNAVYLAPPSVALLGTSYLCAPPIRPDDQP